MTVIVQICGIAVGLGFLVFIHELGHFFAARICRVKILTFSLGFGPDLVKRTYRGTKYCLKAVPFGGFVEMAGEDPEKATGAKGEFLSLRWYKKAGISFAGPLANYILAVFLFAFVFNVWGVCITERGQAGISLEGKTDKYVSFAAGTEGISFGADAVALENTRAGLAAGAESVRVKTGFLESLYLGVKASIAHTVMPVVYLADRIMSLEKPDVIGPVGIMRVMGNAAKDGLHKYLKLVAVISVALGLFNLFPIPMVDGGMMMLFAVEGIVRKRISAKVVRAYNTVGLVLILCIFLFATYGDILRLNILKLLKICISRWF
jgi:regulator of sigma E protease